MGRASVAVLVLLLGFLLWGGLGREALPSDRDDRDPLLLDRSSGLEGLPGSESLSAPPTPRSPPLVHLDPNRSASRAGTDRHHGDLEVTLALVGAAGATLPMGGVELLLEDRSGVQAGSRPQWVRETDEEGRARWEGVAPGAYRCRSARLGTLAVTISPGRCSRFSWTVGPLLTLSGLVTTLDGAPVPGADIWLSAQGNRRLGSVVARADEDGVYRLEMSAMELRHVAAFSRQHGHSILVPVPVPDGSERVPRRLDLQLAEGGRRPWGWIVDADHEPLARARVRIEIRSSAGSLGADGIPTPGRSGPSAQVLSDEDGRFESPFPLAGVSFRLAVSLDGHADRVVEGSRFEDGSIVVLEPEAVVRGRVLDAEGRAASGAAVVLVPAGDPTDPRVLQCGELGAFAYRGLEAGAYLLRVARAGHQPHAESCEVGPGELLEREIRLLPLEGETVSGRILPPRPAMGGDWLVFATGPSERATTRAIDGDFTLPGWQERALTLELAHPDLVDLRFPVLVREQGPLQGLLLHAPQVLLGRPLVVMGTLDVVGGDPAAHTVSARMRGGSQSCARTPVDAGGHFEVELPFSGDWVIEILTAGGVPLKALHLGHVEGERVDLGRIAAGGTLAIEFDLSAVDGNTIECRVLSEDGSLVRGRMVQAHGSVLFLPAGRYQVLTGARGAWTRHRVEGHAGETCRLDVPGPSPAAGSLEIRCEGLPRHGSPGPWIEVRTAEDLAYTGPPGEDGVLRLDLPPGRYTVRIRERLEWRDLAEADLHVGDRVVVEAPLRSTAFPGAR